MPLFLYFLTATERYRKFVPGRLRLADWTARPRAFTLRDIYEHR